MSVAVADTHAALWYLFADSRLSAVARSFILEAADDGHKIAVSSISLVEVVYLVEKGRVPVEAYDAMVSALSDPDHVFIEAVFTSGIVEAMRTVSRSQVPDRPDRMVAATAVYLDVPVISRDRMILAANLQTIW